LLLVAACRDEKPCERDQDAVESCQRTYRVDMCETAERRCQVHCAARLDCAGLDRVDDGLAPEWYERCQAKCRERVACSDAESVPAGVACDGVEDCVDGTDERGCTYHTCLDGELVREDAHCDGYAQCQDESDEEGCR
jgi:hypothetical protein